MNKALTRRDSTADLREKLQAGLNVNRRNGWHQRYVLLNYHTITRLSTVVAATIPVTHANAYIQGGIYRIGLITDGQLSWYQKELYKLPREKSNWWSYPVVMHTNTVTSNTKYIQRHNSVTYILRESSGCLMRLKAHAIRGELVLCTVKIVTTHG